MAKLKFYICFAADENKRKNTSKMPPKTPESQMPRELIKQNYGNHPECKLKLMILGRPRPYFLNTSALAVAS